MIYGLKESRALIVEELQKMNAHVLPHEGRVNHNEGRMGHADLHWHQSPRPGLAVLLINSSGLEPIIIKKEMTLLCCFVTTCLTFLRRGEMRFGKDSFALWLPPF